MRFFVRLFLCASMALAAAGCSSGKGGPDRPISIDDDVVRVKSLTEFDLADFHTLPPTRQASARNHIVTARMYVADMEYHHYETRLTREMQEEGLLATAASLGLTTTATLVPVAQTKTLLSGIATAVTGMDKAYIEKQLLSNTMQALQTQMRADRKTQAGVIYAKLFRGAGNARSLTPIEEYTLPMALSDADSYYQAGTLSSALIGLSKTMANREESADQAKASAGPNAVAVADVKLRAQTASILASSTVPISEPFRTSVLVEEGRGRFEQQLRGDVIKKLQKVACAPENGTFNADLRTKLIAHLAAKKDPAFPDRLTVRDGNIILNEFRAIAAGAPPQC